MLGVAQGQPGVDDPALACELLHDLMVIALGGGAGDWAQRISDNQQKNKVDLLMFGDFGKDQDDEKALAMAVTLQYAKVIDRMTVVTNLGDSRMRARLAKGTLNVLEARNVAVAVGSDGGRPGEEIHEYEFAGCNYLAAEEELFPGPGVELAVQAMVHARASGNPLMIVCNSALTDMAELLAHPRWEECSRGVVGGVVLMGGVTPPTERGVELDKTAQNNSFDLPSANKACLPPSAASSSAAAAAAASSSYRTSATSVRSLTTSAATRRSP